MRRLRVPSPFPLPVWAASVAGAVLALLAGGCAAPASPRDVLALASEHPPNERAASPEDAGSPDSVELRAARIARLRQALLDGASPDPALAEEIRQVIDPEDPHALDANAAPTEAVAVLLDRVADAETLEPGWNKVHYSCGFALGILGFSREATFEVLDGWERFEHDTEMGKQFGFSMQEGAFGYLWDLEIGMAGYSAAIAYLKGEGREVSDDTVAWRRGGYSN